MISTIIGYFEAAAKEGLAEANPYLTVMALADRVAEGIRNRLPELPE